MLNQSIADFSTETPLCLWFNGVRK